MRVDTETTLWLLAGLIFICILALYTWFGGFLAGQAAASGALNHRLRSLRFQILFMLATLFWPVMLFITAVEERHRRKGASIGE